MMWKCSSQYSLDGSIVSYFPTRCNRPYAAFWWCRIYRVYDFRVGNNVLVKSEPVFTSRELVKKKAARVGERLATFTLFPLSPVQKAGNNGTEKLLSTLDRVSCTNYFMSIEIIRCSVRRIETTKPDKKTICGKITLYLFNMTQQCAVAGLPRRPMTVVLMPRMQTSRAYEFMGVNPRVSHLSHHTRTRHLSRKRHCNPERVWRL